MKHVFDIFQTIDSLKSFKSNSFNSNDINLNDIDIIEIDNIEIYTINEKINETNLINYLINKNDSSTSFYLINIGEIYKSLEQINKYSIYFNVSTNPDINLLILLMKLNVKFICNSKQDIDLIYKFMNTEIIYFDVCMNPSNISYAKLHSITNIIVSTEFELKYIKKYYNTCNVIIKLNSINQLNKLITLSNELNLHTIGVKCNNYTIDDIDDINYIQTHDKIKLLILDNTYSNNFEHDDRIEILINCDENIINSHTLFVNIIGIKDNENNVREYTISDGIYNNLNKITTRTTLKPLKNKHDNKKRLSLFFGQTCDSLDVITLNEIIFDEMDIGDWCVINNLCINTIINNTKFNGFDKSKLFFYF